MKYVDIDMVHQYQSIPKYVIFWPVARLKRNCEWQHDFLPEKFQWGYVGSAPYEALERQNWVMRNSMATFHLLEDVSFEYQWWDRFHGPNYMLFVFGSWATTQNQKSECSPLQRRTLSRYSRLCNAWPLIAQNKDPLFHVFFCLSTLLQIATTTSSSFIK